MSASVAHAPKLDPYSERVAALLRGYLAEKRIQNRDLARRIGQTDWWVGRRVNAQTALTVGDLAEIAESLGEPLTRFLPEDTLRDVINRLPDLGAPGGIRTPKPSDPWVDSSDLRRFMKPLGRPITPQRRSTDRRNVIYLDVYRVRRDVDQDRRNTA